MTEPKPISILMFCWNFPPAIGGIESVADHLWREWRAKDCPVAVVARFGRQEDPEEHVFRPRRPGLLRYLPHAWRTGMRLVRARRPAILVCAGIVDAPIAWLLSRWYRIPYVVLAHGSDIQRRGLIYQFVVRFLFRRAAGVGANSVHTRMLLEEAGCDSRRIRIIHPGVALPAFSNNDISVGNDLRSRYQLGKGPVLLTAGRVIRRKGIGEFVDEVLPSLCMSFPDLRYVVVGEDATESLAHPERLLAQIKARVTARGLADHVRFPGRVSDPELWQWYELADLFVLPVIPVAGDVEGFGIVLLEANLQHTPVVASRIGGIPDAVVDGKTGRLVEPGDWDALRDCITGLLRDEELRRMMGEAGYQRAAREFAWSVIGREYLHWLNDVVCSVTGGVS